MHVKDQMEKKLLSIFISVSSLLQITVSS